MRRIVHEPGPGQAAHGVATACRGNACAWALRHGGSPCEPCVAGAFPWWLHARVMFAEKQKHKACAESRLY
jgi:hypothetical protein